MRRGHACCARPDQVAGADHRVPDMLVIRWVEAMDRDRWHPVGPPASVAHGARAPGTGLIRSGAGPPATLDSDQGVLHAQARSRQARPPEPAPWARLSGQMSKAIIRVFLNLHLN